MIADYCLAMFANYESYIWLVLLIWSAAMLVTLAVCSVAGRCSRAEEQRDSRLDDLDRRIREREQLEQRLAAERRMEFERRFRKGNAHA